jgi:hypothetical protein
MMRRPEQPRRRACAIRAKHLEEALPVHASL